MTDVTYYHEFSITLATEEKEDLAEMNDLLAQAMDLFCNCNGDGKDCRIGTGSTRINITEEQFDKMYND